MKFTLKLTRDNVADMKSEIIRRLFDEKFEDDYECDLTFGTDDDVMFKTSLDESTVRQVLTNTFDQQAIIDASRTEFVTEVCRLIDYLIIESQLSDLCENHMHMQHMADNFPDLFDEKIKQFTDAQYCERCEEFSEETLARVIEGRTFGDSVHSCIDFRSFPSLARHVTCLIRRFNLNGRMKKLRKLVTHIEEKPSILRRLVVLSTTSSIADGLVLRHLRYLAVGSLDKPLDGLCFPKLTHLSINNDVRLVNFENVNLEYINAGGVVAPELWDQIKIMPSLSHVSFSLQGWLHLVHEVGVRSLRERSPSIKYASIIGVWIRDPHGARGEHRLLDIFNECGLECISQINIEKLYDDYNSEDDESSEDEAVVHGSIEAHEKIKRRASKDSERRSAVVSDSEDEPSHRAPSFAWHVRGSAPRGRMEEDDD